MAGWEGFAGLADLIGRLDRRLTALERTTLPFSSGSGAPTHTPSRVAAYYDELNDRWYVWDGAWKKVTLTA